MTIPADKSAPLTPTQLQGNTAFATSVALLLLRLVFGWIFVYAGAGKAFGSFGGFGIEKTAEGIGPMMPTFLPQMAWAYLVAYSELLGGLLIMLGLFTRLASVPLLITMIVAIKVATGMNGFGGTFDDKGNFQLGYAYNLILATLAVAFILTGPGLVSLDALLFRRNLLARGPQPLSDPIKRPG